MTARERWIHLRNRLLGDATFRRWAMRVPILRGIARRRAAGLFDVVAGFVYSQVLVAGIELGVFDRLRGGARSTGELAAPCGLPEAAMLRWLRAAAALGLTEALPGERWALGMQGAALAAEPGIAAMVAHHRLLYADLADPVALLRRGRGGLADYWPYGAADGERVAGYSALMAASQPMVARELLGAWPLGRARRLLDIGGGEGAFARAAAARWPKLTVTVFDLPAVVARVPPTDRVRVAGGSFHDGLPGGHDTATLVRILHDHDDAPARALLSAARAALEPDGTLLIAEPMAGTRGAAAMGDAYFGMYLWAMGSGRPRRAAEIIGMARDAGFRHAREVPTATPLICRVVAATV